MWVSECFLLMRGGIPCVFSLLTLTSAWPWPSSYRCKSGPSLSMTCPTLCPARTTITNPGACLALTAVIRFYRLGPLWVSCRNLFFRLLFLFWYQRVFVYCMVVRRCRISHPPPPPPWLHTAPLFSLVLIVSPYCMLQWRTRPACFDFFCFVNSLVFQLCSRCMLDCYFVVAGASSSRACIIYMPENFAVLKKYEILWHMCIHWLRIFIHIIDMGHHAAHKWYGTSCGS